MITTIKGIQVTNVEIRSTCRELHGEENALEEAIKIIKKAYAACVYKDVNKGVIFNLTLTLDR